MFGLNRKKQINKGGLAEMLRTIEAQYSCLAFGRSCWAGAERNQTEVNELRSVMMAI